MDNSLYRKILLVIEGGEMDAAAIQTARAIARANTAGLLVMHVVDHMMINRMKRISQQSAAEIEIELEEKGWKALYFVEEAAKDAGIPTMILQKSGFVEKEVLSEASRLDVDLIIMAYSRKLPGQARRLAQGRFEKVVENAHCSVLIVK
jgi:nucleotide-binding universal stress UspA family protein